MNAITARVLVAVDVLHECMAWLSLHTDAPKHAALSPQSQEIRPTKEYRHTVLE
jgi:hypothetical protein